LGKWLAKGSFIKVVLKSAFIKVVAKTGFNGRRPPARTFIKVVTKVKSKKEEAFIKASSQSGGGKSLPFG
jgi:hypothetical protein